MADCDYDNIGFVSWGIRLSDKKTWQNKLPSSECRNAVQRSEVFECGHSSLFQGKWSTYCVKTACLWSRDSGHSWPPTSRSRPGTQPEWLCLRGETQTHTANCWACPMNCPCFSHLTSDMVTMAGWW